jgi:hypothetical protein
MAKTYDNYTYHEAQKRNDEGSLNMSETYDNYTYYEAQKRNYEGSLNMSETYDNYKNIKQQNLINLFIIKKLILIIIC